MRSFISVFLLCLLSSTARSASWNECKQILADQYKVARTVLPTGHQVDVQNAHGESVLSESVRGHLVTPSSRVRLHATRVYNYHTVLLVVGPPWVWVLEKSDNQNKFTLKNRIWVCWLSQPNEDIKVAISKNGEYFGVLNPQPDAVSRSRILTFKTRASELIVASYPLKDPVDEFRITATGGVEL